MMTYRHCHDSSHSLLILQMSSLPQLRVSINGLQTHAVYNSDSAFSSVSLQFCTRLSTHPNNFPSTSSSSSESPLRLSVTFTILTSTGSFTSTMTMHISKYQTEAVIFGRDWFNYCSADVPLATRTMDLIEPGMCLCFGTLPQSCIRARVSLGHILIITILCLTNDLSLGNSTVVTEQCLSTQDHDFLMLDSDVPLGPGAAISSLDFNMGSCSSTIVSNNLSNVDSLDYESLADVLTAVEKLTKVSLISLAQAHSITFSLNCTITNLRGIISNHLSHGLCVSGSSEACIRTTEKLFADLQGVNGNDEIDQTVMLSNLEIQALSSVLQQINLRPIRRILDLRNISYSHSDSLSKLRKQLKIFITSLKKGKKRAEIVASKYALDAEYKANKDKIAKSWPQLVSSDLKEKIVKMFRAQTSKESLSTFTCASCAESTLCTNCQPVLASGVDLNLLKFDQDPCLNSGPRLNLNILPLPYKHGPLQDVLLEPAGVTVDENGKLQLLLCGQCHSALKREKIPPLSLANGTFLGPIPDELKDLTIIEEAMIARCRAKCWIVQLKEENPTIVAPDSQRGFKGHIIIYPQRPSEIAKMLPPNLTEIITPICVLFVGSTPPSAEWLCEKAKPLCVRREKSSRSSHLAERPQPTISRHCNKSQAP